MSNLWAPKSVLFIDVSAYGFMDYHAQGQTIPYVFIDIAPPPTGLHGTFQEFGTEEYLTSMGF